MQSILRTNKRISLCQICRYAFSDGSKLSETWTDAGEYFIAVILFEVY
jgi:hypothetical protein